MFLPMFVSDSSEIMYLLGEMDRNSSSKAGRLFMRTQTLILASMSLLATVFCFRHRKVKKTFAWLKLFELMKNSLKSTDLKLTEYMALLVWRNTLTIMTLYKVFQAGYVLTVAAVIGYTNKEQIRSGDMVTILWCVIHGLWIMIVGLQVTGLTAIFRCVIFYFDMRMRKLIHDLDLMNKHDKVLVQLDRAEVLYGWLCEFDLIHVELEKYTLFWQNYILVFIGLGYFLLFFELASFACFWRFMAWAEWTLVGICLFMTLVVWVYIFLKASQVSEHTKELYHVMNRFCLIPTHDFVQVKMDNFVKKFSSVNRQIGFHCYRMFYLSNEFLYHVS